MQAINEKFEGFINRFMEVSQDFEDQDNGPTEDLYIQVETEIIQFCIDYYNYDFEKDDKAVSYFLKATPLEIAKYYRDIIYPKITFQGTIKYYPTQSEVESIVDTYINFHPELDDVDKENNTYLEIQQLIGIKTGDFASIYSSGREWHELSRLDKLSEIYGYIILEKTNNRESGFEFEGVFIHDASLDIEGRNQVDPKEYYGKEYINFINII